ncbi:MAG: hypothetical protein KGL39_10880 [Patescibacteria group bacterium]|nr:hypothetical protein [Patescibacteria group bacterium]
MAEEKKAAIIDFSAPRREFYPDMTFVTSDGGRLGFHRILIVKSNVTVFRSALQCLKDDESEISVTATKNHMNLLLNLIYGSDVNILESVEDACAVMALAHKYGDELKVYHIVAHIRQMTLPWPIGNMERAFNECKNGDKLAEIWFDLAILHYKDGKPIDMFIDKHAPKPSLTFWRNVCKVLKFKERRFGMCGHLAFSSSNERHRTSSYE